MTAIRLLVGAMWVLAAIAGHEMWTPKVSAALQAATPAVSQAETLDELDDVERARPRIDVYGNEIDAAVGDYRVDSRGDTYERHSPDTALLELMSAGA